jgi:hypothetical protein
LENAGQYVDSGVSGSKANLPAFDGMLVGAALRL